MTQAPAPDPLRHGRVIQRDVVVVGASAGGVEALRTLIHALPPEFPAAVVVVLHVMSSGKSVLDAILGRAGQLEVTPAVDRERLERGHVYVAPPDRHVLILGDRLRLSAGPRENGHRPAIDPLFRSAARAYGARVIGVILTGNLDDGTDGLRIVKRNGGASVVQDPEEAAYADMPLNAIDFVEPDRVVPIDEMGRTLCELIDTPLEQMPPAPPDPAEQPVDLVDVELGRDPLEGAATTLTCPECGGVLLEREDGPLVRFACQVGHAYSPESLVEEQGEALEGALWAAARTLEERADLLRRMGRRADRRNEGTGGRFSDRAGAVERHIALLRETIVRLRAAENDEPAAAGEPT